jgi:hypothetical protein
MVLKFAPRPCRSDKWGTRIEDRVPPGHPTYFHTPIPQFGGNGAMPSLPTSTVNLTTNRHEPSVPCDKVTRFLPAIFRNPRYGLAICRQVMPRWISELIYLGKIVLRWTRDGLTFALR